ncbi:ketoacyl-synt-domain-containing protein [Periconia macrospinosa]|uniref:Ketoacyl-synt-domain-containing protein n=1 Tax=Periconia macrospinosa TaxID=97972 RepID=A0A2V1D8M6_9PLEO|nr:ketoacyl-synt-domain-containing protein [Periconia macrospinosa]
MEPIAVVGLGLRFPGDAINPKAFWEFLINRQCAASSWPKDRVNIASFKNPVQLEPSSVATAEAHFLQADPSLFDAPFFSITPAEAAALDPQQSLLLETTYQAFENAGISTETLRHSNTGVYIGTMCDDHKHHVLKDVDNVPTYAATGSSSAVLANRISWFFDLVGPSITMDTACSSSLIALHLAAQSLSLGETSMAVVGGCNVLSGVEMPIAMSRMGFLSPDGRCFSFDERANGYARGEGVGVVILKRLSNAIADNDTIRAIIRATGTNQDGYTPGITVPNSLSQARLIKETYEKAGLDLASTRYFESHGTGTAVGDPLEASAIGTVFSPHRSESDPLFIGTLKPNIGHLEGGSGIAGLIKTILILETGVIPPNANFERPNPRIPPKLLRYVKFPTCPVTWPNNGLRRASVNSFGFGGSNAHVIVDDADGYLREHGISGHHSTSREDAALVPNGAHLSKIESKLIVWSANREAALSRMTEAFAKHFDAPDPLGASDHLVVDLAYTMACRRTHHEWRSYAIIESIVDLKNLSQIITKPCRSNRCPSIAFVFTGQGAQYKGMGLQLLQYPVFHETLLSCGEIYTGLGCKWSLLGNLDILSSDDESTSIDHPSYSQPLSTAIQIALINLLESFNIFPSRVVGHSSGEIAAAYAANGISLESACKLSYFRGQLAGTLVNFGSANTMLAVALSTHNISAYLDRICGAPTPLSIACINSPENVTIGGSSKEILRLKDMLDADGVFCRELKTGVAYHTAQMSNVADKYRQQIGKLERGQDPERTATMVSSVTGDWIFDLDELCNPDYWVRNMLQTVRFDEAVSHLLRPSAQPVDSPQISEIVEIGAHSALQRPVTEILASLNHAARYSPSLSRFDTSLKTTLNLMGRLHCAGIPVRLDKVNDIDTTHEAHYKCLSNLPAYTFHHTRPAPKHGLSMSIKHRPHFPLPLLGSPEFEWNALEPRWRRNLNIQQFPWLTDHRINDVVLFPAAGMVAVAIEAAYTMANKDNEILGICLKKAIFLNPIIISTTDDGGTDIRTSLRSTSDASQRDFSYSHVDIYVRQNENWVHTFQCTVQVEYEKSLLSQELSSGAQIRQSQLQTKYLETVKACDRKVKKSSIYPHLERMGMQYGPAFQGLEEVYCNSNCSGSGKISVRKVQELSAGGSEHYFVHPAVLDSLLHLAWIIRSDGATKSIATSVPARLDNIWFSRDWLRGDNMAGQELRTCNTTVEHGFGGLDTSALVVNEAGEVVMTLDNLQTTISSREHIELKTKAPRRLCYSLETKPDLESLDSDHVDSILKASETSLADYLELILHKNPETKILDVTSTQDMLHEFLRKTSKSPQTFARYDLLNVPQALVESISEQHAEECAAGILRFPTLNFESSLKGQGFEPNSYDVIIFSTTSLSFTNDDSARKNFIEFLKAGGRLIEVTSKPTINGKNESGILCINAFPTQEDDFDIEQRNRFAVSTLSSVENSHTFPEALTNCLIVVDDTSENLQLAYLIEALVKSKWSLDTSITQLSKLKVASTLPQAHVIFLPEISKPFLRHMSADEFTVLKLLMEVGQHVYWITKSQQTSISPSLNMVHGLARVLRSEKPSRGFTTISLEQSSTMLEDVAVIIKLFGLNILSNSRSSETEYFVKKGIVNVQRIVENESLDKTVLSGAFAQEHHVSLQKAGPVELEIQSPGVFDSLRCVQTSSHPILEDDEVEVQVHAFGLNFKDVVIALGRLPQSKLGCECAGVITRVGRNARLKPGTRVMMAQNACMKTVNRCHQDLVVEIPASLSFEEAAAIPIAGVTAYYSLVEQARLQPNETVLIHSGAGATGQMCIQIALLLGAKVYTTVSSQEKQEFLTWRYGLEPEQIYFSRDTSFATSILAATDNKGVDVVVNSLAGDKLQASWEVVAPFGRFIELGRTDILGNSKLAMAYFAKNISFMAVAVDDMVALRPAMLQRNLAAVVGMIEEGKLNLPFPLKTYPLSSAKDAFQHLMSGKSTGKMVLKVDPTDVVKACITQDSGKRLDPDATYLIAGGFGGLGRSAARWMVSKGARNLILLSRSGPISESARALIEELESKDIRVAAKACDIGDEVALAALLDDCASHMPPVRGCLQGTMVLRDALFENMTYSDWTTSTHAKVLASENLDKLLPSGMQFFIMLSSLSGIVGVQGQANYAAGNTFQDALALSRIQRGEKAVSLDLGVMNKVGVVAENEDIARAAQAHMLSVEEEELHALLDHYCFSSPPTTTTQAEPSQVGTIGEQQLLVGLPTTHFLQSNGGTIPTAYSQPLFSRLSLLDQNDTATSTSSTQASPQSSKTDYTALFGAAPSSVEAAAVVVDGLISKLSQTLSLSTDELDPLKPLQHYGVDSLIAVEMRNWFAKEFSSNVAIFTFLGAPSIAEVGRLVVDGSTLRKGDGEK